MGIERYPLHSTLRAQNIPCYTFEEVTRSMTSAKRPRRAAPAETAGLWGLLEALGEARRRGDDGAATLLHNELLQRLRRSTEKELGRLRSSPESKEEG
jgi:hypothetical protein